jgi:2-dehydropantoate 2-reductase
MADPTTRSLAKSLMQEVATAAAGYDRHISPAFIEQMLSNTEEMKPYRTSMKIDFDTGKPLEIETMFGNPLRAAQKVGVETHRIEMLYQQLQFLSDRRFSSTTLKA